MSTSRNISWFLEKTKILPAINIYKLSDAVPIAESLLEAGCDLMEITLRTPCALEAIECVRSVVPDMIVSAGTVKDKLQFDDAVEAGAHFIVSPGISVSLLKCSHDRNVPLLPGAVTPSEIMLALSYEVDTLKFFPASCYGGTEMLKALAGPFPEANFCPTGGISLENAKDYLALKNVKAIGGSFLIDQNLVQEQNWAALTQDIKNKMTSIAFS